MERAAVLRLTVTLMQTTNFIDGTWVLGREDVAEDAACTCIFHHKGGEAPRGVKDCSLGSQGKLLSMEWEYFLLADS